METPRYIDFTGNPVVAPSSPRDHRNAGVRLSPDLFKPLCLPPPLISQSIYTPDDKTCDSELVPPAENLSLDSLERFRLSSPLIPLSTYSAEDRIHDNESLQTQERLSFRSLEPLRLPPPLLRSASASIADDETHDSEQVQLQERSGSDNHESPRLSTLLLPSAPALNAESHNSEQHPFHVIPGIESPEIPQYSPPAYRAKKRASEHAPLREFPPTYRQVVRTNRLRRLSEVPLLSRFAQPASRALSDEALAEMGVYVYRPPKTIREELLEDLMRVASFQCPIECWLMLVVFLIALAVATLVANMR